MNPQILNRSWKLQNFSGKNLFNANDSVIPGIKDGTACSGWRTSVFPASYDLSKIFPINTTVTMSFDVECIAVPEFDTSGSWSTLGFYLYKASDSKNFIFYDATYLTVGEKRHCKFTQQIKGIENLDGYSFYVYTNGYLKDGVDVMSTMKFSNIQVEIGNVETSYEPYNGGSTDSLRIENCKGGYFSVVDDYGLKVIGKTEQKALTGKNLLNPPDSDKSITMQGVTWVMTPDGHITADGIATGYSAMKIATVHLVEGTYRLTFKAGSTYENIAFGVAVYDAAGTKIMDKTCTASYPIISAPEGAATMDVIIKRNNDAAVFADLWLMLEEGDIATEYEPYCGGVPSPNPDYPQEIQCVKQGTKVTVRGKNLLPRFENQEEHGVTYAVNRDGSVHVYGKANITSTSRINYVTLSPGTYIRTSPSNLLSIILQKKDETKYYGKRFSLTEEEQIAVWIQIPRGTVIDTVIYPQIEIGTNETPYEPYAEPQAVTVPCDLYEGDVWYPMTGKVVKNCGTFTFDGSEKNIDGSNAWNDAGLHSDGMRVIIYGSKANLYSAVRDTGYCREYKRIPYSNILANNMAGSYAMFGDSGIQVRTNETTLANFLTQLQQNNMHIVYQRKEPVVEYYEPQPIYAPRGAVNITQDPIDLSADLSAAMFTHVKQNQLFPIDDLGDYSRIAVNSINTDNIIAGEKFTSVNSPNSSLIDKTIYLELDTSTINSSLQNIISVGANINSWQSAPFIMHAYYPSSENTNSIVLALNTNNRMVQYNIPIAASNNILKLAICKNGIYGNGQLLVNADTLKSGSVVASSRENAEFRAEWFNSLCQTATNMMIGSQEGTTRSTATYKAIKIYDAAMTSEQLTKLTTLLEDEKPQAQEDSQLNYIAPGSISCKGSTTTLPVKLLKSISDDWTMLISFESIVSNADAALAIARCGDFSITANFKLNRIAVNWGDKTYASEISLADSVLAQFLISKTGSVLTIEHLGAYAPVTLVANNLVAVDDDLVLGDGWRGTVSQFAICDRFATKEEALELLPAPQDFYLSDNAISVEEGKAFITHIIATDPATALGRIENQFTAYVGDAGNDFENTYIKVEIDKLAVTIKAKAAGQSAVRIIYNNVEKVIPIIVTEAEVYADPSILYQLPTEKTFVASNNDYIDTGVKLLDADKDFTVFLDFTGSDSNIAANDTHALLHCMRETNPWPGLSVQIDTATYVGHWYDKHTGSLIGAKDNSRHKLAFVHEAGSPDITFYFDDNDPKTVLRNSNTYDISQTLMLGCFRASNNTLGRFWNGIIHRAIVYNVAKTAEEINELCEI